jgi:hypothetical protein
VLTGTIPPLRWHSVLRVRRAISSRDPVWLSYAHGLAWLMPATTYSNSLAERIQDGAADPAKIGHDLLDIWLNVLRKPEDEGRRTIQSGGVRL